MLLPVRNILPIALLLLALWSRVLQAEENVTTAPAVTSAPSGEGLSTTVAETMNPNTAASDKSGKASETTSGPASVPATVTTSGSASVPATVTTSGPASVPATVTTSGSANGSASGPAIESTSVPATETTSVPASVPASGPSSETTSGSASVPATETANGSASVPSSETTSGPASGPSSETTSGSASVPATETANGSASVPSSETTSGPASDTPGDQAKLVSGSTTSQPNTPEELEAILRMMKTISAVNTEEEIVTFGKLCKSSEECQDFPSVTCVMNSLRVATCRCSYLATLAPGANEPADKHVCILNVFSPCSQIGEPDGVCTANARCDNDTLGMSNTKYCRCLRRFKPAPNDEKFPAFCVPDDSVEEVTGDYEYGAALPRIHIPANYKIRIFFVSVAILIFFG